MAEGLTPKQAAFVAEYLVDFHGTRAAIRAGYSEHGAAVTASKLLRKPNILAAVEAGRERKLIKTEITQDRVLRETQLLAFSDVTHYTVDEAGNLALAEGAPPDAMRAVSSVKRRVVTTGAGENARTTHEVEFRLWDKPGMIKLAGRHVDTHGFADRVEVTGKNGGAIQSETKVCFYVPMNGREADEP